MSRFKAPMGGRSGVMGKRGIDPATIGRAAGLAFKALGKKRTGKLGGFLKTLQKVGGIIESGLGIASQLGAIDPEKASTYQSTVRNANSQVTNVRNALDNPQYYSTTQGVENMGKQILSNERMPGPQKTAGELSEVIRHGAMATQDEKGNSREPSADTKTASSFSQQALGNAKRNMDMGETTGSISDRMATLRKRKNEAQGGAEPKRMASEGAPSGSSEATI